MDIEAFEQLFRAMHAPLCEVVDSYVRSQAVAEEIVQDVFFVMWLRRDRMPATDKVRAYLFATARNRAVRHLRHLAVVRRWSLLAEGHPDVAGVSAHGPLPDSLVESRERSAALGRAIDELPPRPRLALVLQTRHEMTNADIAMAMGISIKGVEKLLSTARQKLRDVLGAHANIDPAPDN